MVPPGLSDGTARSRRWYRPGHGKAQVCAFPEIQAVVPPPTGDGTTKAQYLGLCSAIVPYNDGNSTASTPKNQGFEIFALILKPFRIYKYLTHSCLLKHEK
ncbi:hypothetical protein GW17_00021514 [Ensete ventricosum]|nr:hypothetical protein GW17_00021514 [Ensete ventricosum]